MSERPAVVTPHEVALLRVVAQRLAGPPAASPGAAVRWLGAVQGQDFPGALVSVAVRTRGVAREAVEAALDAGDVVRSWPMRGTLHLTPAVDVGWMLDVVAPRVLASTARRRAQLGLDEESLTRAQAEVERALAGGRRLVRSELMSLWESAGLAPAGGRGYHLLFHLALRGIVCFGPVRSGEQEIVLLEEWVQDPVRLDRDAALAEWALRFFRSHGPASVHDFARWTGLTVGEARRGTSAVEGSLATVVVDGTTLLLDPQTPDRLADHRSDARRVLLLPGFDELILGYADRTFTLDRDHERLVVPGGNGVFAPTIVADGRVIGTWRHTGRGARRALLAKPFTDRLPPAVERTIEAAYAELP
jgi:hypothetical protein